MCIIHSFTFIENDFIDGPLFEGEAREYFIGLRLAECPLAAELDALALELLVGALLVLKLPDDVAGVERVE